MPQPGGAQSCFHGELVSDLRFEARSDTAVSQGGDKLEHVGGAAAANRSYCIKVFLVHGDDMAHRAEDFFNSLLIFALEGIDRSVASDTGSNLAGGIGHGPH